MPGDPHGGVTVCRYCGAHNLENVSCGCVGYGLGAVRGEDYAPADIHSWRHRSPLQKSPRECAPPPSEVGGLRPWVFRAAAYRSCLAPWVCLPAEPVEPDRRRL